MVIGELRNRVTESSDEAGFAVPCPSYVAVFLENFSSNFLSLGAMTYWQ